MCAPVAITTGSGLSAIGAILMSQIIALAVLVGILIWNFKDNLKQMLRA